MQLTLLGFVNNNIMIIMTSKVLNVTSPDSVVFDRNEIGPYFVLTSMLYNNIFIIALQVGKQNRSYLVTNQFSAISKSLLENLKRIDKHSDLFCILLIFSFPLNFLLTPLIFKEIKTFTPLIYLMFIFGVIFCLILVLLSFTTKNTLKKQLVGILKSNESRIIKEPLNAKILISQNKLINSVLLQEKIQFQLCMSNGISTVLFILLGMPFQYLLHPYNYCSSAAAHFLFVVRPFLLVCKNENAKCKNKKLVFISSASKKSVQKKKCILRSN